MAKELPYFKFEPGAWDNGKIQMCSPEARSLFISVCCMYWQRLGDLPHALAVGKICNGNEAALEPLVSVGVVKVIEGKICIDFLDEQLAEFDYTSKTNSENARSGWEKRKKKGNDATAMRPHSDCNAIREEEKRGEEILLPKNEISDWETWGKLIVSGNDAQWNDMRGRKISQQEMDSFLSVAARNNWKIETQQKFRTSLKGFKDFTPNKEKEPAQLVYTKGRAFGS